MGIFRYKTPEFEARQVTVTRDWTVWKPIMEWIDSETTMALLDKNDQPYGIMFERPYGATVSGTEKIFAKIGDFICKNTDGYFSVINMREMEEQYEFVRLGPDLDGTGEAAPMAEAICDTCGAPKGTHALGEQCNNNCGGRVIPNPALESQD